jgi:hypothetical protein
MGGKEEDGLQAVIGRLPTYRQKSRSIIKIVIPPGDVAAIRVVSRADFCLLR